MPKKVSEVDRIMTYIETAPISAVEVVMDLANAKFKARKKEIGGPATAPKKRAANAPKPNSAAHPPAQASAE